SSVRPPRSRRPRRLARRQARRVEPRWRRHARRGGDPARASTGSRTARRWVASFRARPRDANLQTSTKGEVMQKELAYRENDGVAVAPLWQPGTDRFTVSGVDRRPHHAVELHRKPPGAPAGFQHPHAYAALPRPAPP